MISFSSSHLIKIWYNSKQELLQESASNVILDGINHFYFSTNSNISDMIHAKNNIIFLQNSLCKVVDNWQK